MMKTCRGKVDWLLLETRVRTILRAYAREEVSTYKALRLIDENLAALTLRGSELPADNLPYTPHRSETKQDRVVGVEQDKIWAMTEMWLRGEHV